MKWDYKTQQNITLIETGIFIEKYEYTNEVWGTLNVTVKPDNIKSKSGYIHIGENHIIES